MPTERVKLYPTLPRKFKSIDEIRDYLARLNHALEEESTDRLRDFESMDLVPGMNHPILDGSTHSDSVAGTVTRGDLIYGNSTPKWARLPKGTSGQVVQTDGTDVSWGVIPVHASRHNVGGADALTMPWIDANSYSTLALAVAGIGATEATLLVSSAETVSADLTIPANIHLWFTRGGQLDIATTKTVTINGSLEAGLFQIFNCTGTGKVTFGKGGIGCVYPQWWGAMGDNATDCTVGIQAAIDAMEVAKGTIFFAHGDYKITSKLEIGAWGVRLLGEMAGTQDDLTSTRIFASSFGSSQPMISINMTTGDYVEIEKITLDAEDDANVSACIKIDSADSYYPVKLIDVVTTNASSGAGILIGSHVNYLSMTRIWQKNCNYGLQATGHANFNITAVDCMFSGLTMSLLIGEDGTEAQRCQGWHFNRCVFFVESNFTTGVQTRNAWSITFNQCHFETAATGTDMLVIGGTSGSCNRGSHIQVTDCLFILNSVVANGINIQLADNCSITGTRIQSYTSSPVRITDTVYSRHLIELQTLSHDKIFCFGGLPATYNFTVKNSGSDNYIESLVDSDHEVGYRVKRNTSGGSYNDSWIWYMPTDAKDLRLWNTAGGTYFLKFTSSNGRLFIAVPATVPDDADLWNSSMSAYLDEVNDKLKFRVRKSDSTLETYEVPTSLGSTPIYIRLLNMGA